MPATIYSATPVAHVRRTNMTTVVDHPRIFTIDGQAGLWVKARYVAHRPELVDPAAAPAGGNVFATVSVHTSEAPMYGVNEFTRDATLEGILKTATTGL